MLRVLAVPDIIFSKKGGWLMKKSIFLSIVVLASAFIFIRVYAGDIVAGEAKVYFLEGVQAQKNDNLEKAVADYTKARLVSKEDIEYQKYIINNMGAMYLRQGDVARAEAAFVEALTIDPDYEPAKLNLGIINEMRMSELDSLKYWIKVLDIDLDEIKPKGPILEDLSSQKKK